MIREQDSHKIREIEATLQQHMNLFGYELIEMPIIADADIFLTRAGNSIVEQLFTFERFGKSLALRPEFTALLAHQYAQNNLSDPVRWQLSGSIFIDEPSDYSLQYQQHNIGAEFIGSHAPLADTEIMAMAVQGIEKLNITNWELVVGHVGLQLHLLSQFGLDSRTLRILLSQRYTLKEKGKQVVLDYLSDILMLDNHRADKKETNGEETQQVLDMLLDSTRYTSTMGGRTRHDIAERIMKKHERGLEIDNISQALDFLQHWGNIRGTVDDVLRAIDALIADDDSYGQSLLSDWCDVLGTLSAYGIKNENITLQPDLTKNWDYYTGFVFGIRVNDDYVASGGRYDGLTRLLGSDDAIPAVGFAYYSQKLAVTLPAYIENQTKYTLSSANPEIAIQWAQALRQNGIAIELVADNAQIIIYDKQAIYNDTPYTLEQLIEELSS
mgnify:CR=1 FL=1